MKSVKIKGMSCQHCVMAVTKALNEVAGIKNLEVNLSRGEATFEESEPVDMEWVRNQVRKAGYEIG